MKVKDIAKKYHVKVYDLLCICEMLNIDYCKNRHSYIFANDLYYLELYYKKNRVVKKTKTTLTIIKPCKSPNGLWGYRNHCGRWVIKPQYVEANEFLQDGYALVRLQNRNKMRVLINKTNTIIAECTFSNNKYVFKRQGSQKDIIREPQYDLGRSGWKTKDGFIEDIVAKEYLPDNTNCTTNPTIKHFNDSIILENHKLYDNQFDGIQYTNREYGKFGSIPSFDDYGDESIP